MTKTMRQRLRLGTHASVAATGLATVLALSVPAYADGDAQAKARGPGVASLSALRRDVVVDLSALDALPRTRGPQLLIAQNSAGPLAPIFNDSTPIVLQPPPGVAPVLIPPASMKGTGKLNTTAAVKLRPPPGVKPVAPVRTASAEAKRDVAPPAPKAEAPKPAPKVEIAKAEPPKAVAPAPAPKAAAPAPVAPPKAAAPVAPPGAPPVAPPPAPKVAAPTPVAPAPVAPPVAPPAAKAEVQPAPKPAVITPPPPPAPPKVAAVPAPAPVAPPAAGAPRSLLPDTKPETKVAVIPPVAETPKASEAPAEAKPEEPKAEAQTAALPPPAKATIPDTLTIAFDVGVPDVPGAATADLKGLAARMKADAALRVQLLAFASDPEKSVSRSRRLSLERAVNVRKQLLSAGIDSTRIEVRALGEQSGDGAPDRVDAITSRR